MLKARESWLEMGLTHPGLAKLHYGIFSKCEYSFVLHYSTSTMYYNNIVTVHCYSTVQFIRVFQKYCIFIIMIQKFADSKSGYIHLFDSIQFVIVFGYLIVSVNFFVNFWVEEWHINIP